MSLEVSGLYKNFWIALIIGPGYTPKNRGAIIVSLFQLIFTAVFLARNSVSLLLYICNIIK